MIETWQVFAATANTALAVAAGWFVGKSKRKTEAAAAELAATTADEAVFKLQGNQIAWLTGEVKRLQAEVIDLRQQQLEQAELLRVREMAHTQEIHQLHVTFEREKQALLAERTHLATSHQVELAEAKTALEAAKKGLQ